MSYSGSQVFNPVNSCVECGTEAYYKGVRVRLTLIGDTLELPDMQDIVGANCGCGSETIDSTSVDRQEKSCSICGEELVKMTYYSGAKISVCPNCN